MYYSWGARVKNMKQFEINTFLKRFLLFVSRIRHHGNVGQVICLSMECP